LCDFELFSILEINLAFGASEPIALHVWANNANGLFLASSAFGIGAK
jgi:hypothetical protein